ncbi:hypothetical protein MKK58_26290 [Methylobacterium sp. J-078]|uniref:hypothetical protein n=1 Tax=Methylobacterium sp. J-078 TaxID=2836657 RepID=UPI001FB86BE7|nr:hypothetical protein [Methylobacterium sp. J-078]MCJ2048021.1 hypothetical protein [Methylobacterium sp. J-078]
MAATPEGSDAAEKRAANRLAIVGLLVTVLLAFLGYLATYVNNAASDARKAQIELVNDQLERLYGPLLALATSSTETWETFRCKFRSNTYGYFDDRAPPGREEVEKFRLYSRTVFLPTDRAIKEIITKNAHLIDGSSMPDSFLKLMTHTQMFEAVSSEWRAEDDLGSEDQRMAGRNVALVGYPIELEGDVTRTFNKLKARQECLLAEQRVLSLSAIVAGVDCQRLSEPEPHPQRSRECPKR